VKPYEGEFSVTRLGNGQIVSTGSTIRGRKMELGRMALLTIDGVSIVVSSKRMQAYDPGLFRHVGVDPKIKKSWRSRARFISAPISSQYPKKS
jgi:microcystin degradation protein MlrC